jgi:hypothetical protein
MTKQALKIALAALGNSWTEPGTLQYEIEQEAITAIKEAIAELENQQPVAWADMGTRDVDNDAGLSWTTGHFHTTPLYTHPPQRTEPQIKTTDPFESARVVDYNRGWNDCLFASGIVKQSQHTWVGLTDEEIKTICVENGWDSSWQSMRFARAIEAKLKEKNT